MLHVTLLCVTVLIPQDEQAKRSFKLSVPKESIGDYVLELSGLMYNKAFYAELEIVESQATEIRKQLSVANKKHNEQMKIAYDQLLETRDQQSYRQATLANMDQHVNRVADILSDSLLPHQIRKLDRFVYWSIIKSYRNSRSLNEAFRFRSRFEHDAIKSLLKIDAKQSKEIQKKVSGMQNEFLNELAELHEKYEKRVAKELRIDQQKTNKQVLGETPSFLFEEND